MKFCKCSIYKLACPKCHHNRGRVGYLCGCTNTDGIPDNWAGPGFTKRNSESAK
jgi:hypothetical protein